MSGFDWLTWVVALAALIGVIFNIKKKRTGFVIWIFTNSFWIVVDYHRGIYAQSALLVCYLGLSIWGVIAWKEGKSRAKAQRRGVSQRGQE